MIHHERLRPPARDYPADVLALYAQGYSVVDFLVRKSSKPTFLAFVAQGQRDGWDKALQVHYRYRSVEELEQAWRQQLRDADAPVLFWGAVRRGSAHVGAGLTRLGQWLSRQPLPGLFRAA